MCAHGALSLQITAIKEAYLPDVVEIYRRTAAKVQHVSFSNRVACVSSKTLVPPRISMQDRFDIAKESHTTLGILFTISPIDSF